MKPENETSLRAAIDHSTSLCEVADASYTGTHKQLLIDLATIWRGELDSCDFEDQVIDVWGWTDDTPENQQDWRLMVTLQDDNEAME